MDQLAQSWFLRLDTVGHQGFLLAIFHNGTRTNVSIEHHPCWLLSYAIQQHVSSMALLEVFPKLGEEYRNMVAKFQCVGVY
jgi:hypothetical protein